MKISRNNPGTAMAGESAFTMVEIALCLAIIAFALVAIIGVLPTGMGVQRDNREETIINQDATVWMDAIRNGARGYDDLTNYVISITNFWTTYTVTPTTTNTTGNGVDWYINNDSSVLNNVGFANGYPIVGLLSMPERISPPPFNRGSASEFQSNYVVAYVRAISGSAVEKFPQRTGEILDSAFQYRLVVQNVPYVPFDPASIDLTAPATNGMTPAQLDERVERLRVVVNQRQNSRDVRLLFRWPILPTGPGNGRQTFRALIGGQLERTNVAGEPLYFFQPTIYGAQ